MSEEINSVKFWINAFIPRDIPSLTGTVPSGPHSGKTMIPGPTPINDCFLTDQRSFSNEIHARSRMHSEFKVTVNGSQLEFTQWHNCDETVEVDCESGEVECEKIGSTSDMEFSFPSNPDPTRPFQITFDSGSSNPCFSGSPTIDYEGTVTIDLKNRRLEFDGKVDEFPAFEAYATINDGAGIALFQIEPEEGKGPADLIGDANISVSGKLEGDDW